MNGNIVQYFLFPQVVLLIILYIQLQALRGIICIINCYIVLYLYFPHVILLIALYINLQIEIC